MIIALYIPEELADAYHKERFQPTLARLKRYARQAGTPTDLKIVQQLEASFCVSREIIKGNGGVPLVGPGFGEAYCQLKAKLENVQATAYAESVDAGMENRRLKRALWLARAMCAQESQYWGAYVRYVHLHENSFYEFINDDIFHRDNPNNDSFRMWSNRWRSVERKCRAKAEEYK